MLSDVEKLELANNIIEHYYNQNFGSMSKSDLEVLIFSQFLRHLRNSGQSYDDYTVSRALGITQSRVRSLKERMELKYSYVHDNWKELFALDLKNAKYDQESHHVKFIVQDINVLNEIRYYVESMGWYDDYSLNRKLLNLPLSCFVDICCDNSELNETLSPETKKAINNIKNQDSSLRKFLEDFTRDGLKDFLMSGGKETISLVLQNLPFVGPARIAFRILSQIISKC